MDDLLTEFLTETSESIDLVDEELVILEQEPDNKNVLDNIFRLVHTIKGTCGFLGLPRLEAVAHASENVLGKFRDGVVKVTPECVTLILESLDQIKELLAFLEANEVEPEGDDADLIKRLNCAAAGELGDSSGAPVQVADEAPVQEMPEIVVQKEVRPGEVSLDELEAAFLAADGPDEETQTKASEDVAPAPVSPPVKAPVAKAKEKSGPSIANQSIRVNVDVLEDLMTMVSELVLTRNQLMQMVRNQEDSEFKVPLQRLSGVTSDLQEAVMKTRMQPIGNAWRKLPRVIRDLGHELDKKITLNMIGADTELDRQVLELIKDPLTHMVRNSADHGLETTDDRIAAGKPAEGTVTLKAYHEGGHIIIEVDDDGRGLPVDKIRKKVLENGLATEAELEKMPEAQILKYVFAAGFSTAAKVTSVSGRGVGMDVVRTNIEVIGGSVDVRSTAGVGSTFIIKIPLTLAIVSALIVECCEQRFAIPQLSVVELVRSRNGSDSQIERINGTPVLRLRNRLLPLVQMATLLELEPSRVVQHVEQTGQSEPLEDQQDIKDEAFIVVSQVGSNTFGIVVDSVFDTEEIVVKPTATMLRDIPLFSGNTILGDGSVIMIIDPNGMASSIATKGATEDDERFEDQQVRTAENDDTVSMLVFKAGSKEPKAVPLSLVTRLEEIEVDRIEFANGQHVVQYRGHLMPIMNLTSGHTFKEEGRQPVLVFTDDDRAVGIAVDEIVDIVEERISIEINSENAGVVGTAVVRDLATDVIDVGHYLVQIYPDWFERLEERYDIGDKRVLYIDDSRFFRHLISPLLTASGYQVVTVSSAEEALELKASGSLFDIIISDIEMPGVNGLGFAEQLDGDEQWGGLPMIALSSNNSPRDVQRSLAAGFLEHVSKANRDRLLEVVNSTLVRREDAA
jgi:two-component system, chemotaxis family, sensor kinase CheA